MRSRGSSPWWRHGVLYQIYPRSFADANGDGIGDLHGIVDRLEYLDRLGIDGIWLNPTMPSPNADWGYDVSDYCSVHPDLGSLEDLDLLVAEAGRRGIRVLLDLVPNHTSDQHAWFLDARSARDAGHRDWYIWADPAPDGSPPNDWQSVFGGPAWTLDERTGQYYLHHFLAEQPDLDWRNEEVRAAFDDILRFWFDRGIAGFRIDVAHEIVKDRRARVDLPETHRVIQRWRALADAYDDPRVLLGETWVFDIHQLAAFYGAGEDELHMAFNFPFLLGRFDGARLRAIVEQTEAALPPSGWPVWTLSNHDNVRFPSRWCEEDDRKIRSALVMLFGLRGTPVLYYGDEIGMPSVGVPDERVRDMAGRDPARTPMQWTAEPGAGFTVPGAEPWLPFGDAGAYNVAAQDGDPGSMLSLTRRLVQLRRELPDLVGGAYSSLDAPDGVWAWRRGDRVIVAVNLSDEEAELPGRDGSVRLSTVERPPGSRRLAAWEGVVVER